LTREERQLFEQNCRRHGLRLTPQRLEIYAELFNSTDHPTAEQLYQRLQHKMPSLSLDTVYRTLATFASCHLINKVETVESQARFEVPHNCHHHLICSSCQQIVDFQWPLVDDASLPDELSAWGQIERKSLVVYGICRNCLRS